MSNFEKIYILIGSYLGVMLLSFGLSYLIWSFGHAGFNFWEWGGLSRTIMVIFFLILTVIGVCVLTWFFEENTELLDFD